MSKPENQCTVPSLSRSQYLSFLAGRYLWTSTSPQVQPSPRQMPLQSDNGFPADLDCQTFCWSFYVSVHFICQTIYLDILTEAKKEASLDVWSEVHAQWQRLAEFLGLLGNELFGQRTIEGQIDFVNAREKSMYRFPILDWLGRIAYRSQVLFLFKLLQLPEASFPEIFR